MSDMIRELAAILEQSGARVTFDPERSTARPCVICRTTNEPRTLVEIGVCTRAMSGNVQPGDPIMRPMCERCRGLTTPTALASDGPRTRRPSWTCYGCGAEVPRGWRRCPTCFWEAAR